MITVYGFDPALRHGCLVKAHFERLPSGPLIIQSVQPIFTWTKGSPLAFNERSGPEVTMKLVSSVWAVINDRVPVSVDWDPESIFWRSRKLQGVQLAFFMGYFSAIGHAKGCEVVFIPPKELRQVLNLPKSKEEAQDVFRRRVAISHLDSPDKRQDFEDWLDAVILAYALASILANTHKEPLPDANNHVTPPPRIFGR